MPAEIAIAEAVVTALLPYAEELGQETVHGIALFAQHMHDLGASRKPFLATLELARKEANTAKHMDGSPITQGWEKELHAIAEVTKIWGENLAKDTGNSFLFALNSIVHLPAAQDAAAAAGNMVAKWLGDKIKDMLSGILHKG